MDIDLPSVQRLHKVAYWTKTGRVCEVQSNKPSVNIAVTVLYYNMSKLHELAIADAAVSVETTILLFEITPKHIDAKRNRNFKAC